MCGGVGVRVVWTMVVVVVISTNLIIIYGRLIHYGVEDVLGDVQNIKRLFGHSNIRSLQPTCKIGDLVGRSKVEAMVICEQKSFLPIQSGQNLVEGESGRGKGTIF